MFDINRYGKEVQELYKELDERLGSKNIDITIDSNKSSGANFYKMPNGNYKIIISEQSQNDYVLSHELLHIYSNIHQILPSMAFFNNTRDNLCELIGMMLCDIVEHSYIIEKQINLGIVGYKDHISKMHEDFLKIDFEESNVVEHNLMLIFRIVIYINDTKSEFLDTTSENYYKGIKERFPRSFEIASAILKLYDERKRDTPYYIRKTIVAIVDTIIEFIDKDVHFIKYDINVLPSFREQQLYMPASVTLDLCKYGNGMYIVTKHDRQAINSGYIKYSYKKYNDLKNDLDNITTKKILELLHLSYYVDDRNGEWHYESGVI